MKTPRLVVAMGEIGDDLISGAIQYKTEEYRYHMYIRKCVLVVAACLVLLLGNMWINHYLSQYLIANDIKVIYADRDGIDADDVTSEQATGIETANKIHNMLSEYNFEWYGSCYYDFETDLIRVGITDLSTDNKNFVLEFIEENEVDIYQCKYSYKYLEEIYNMIDNRRSFFEKLGVERYNISVEENCVNVYISDADNYAAIYAINEMTNGRGGVVFKTYRSYVADS